MIRKRLKAAARKVAIKVLGMEFDTEERAPRPERPDPDAFDPNKIPKIVDGSGDTPGPNHKTDIGRTWVSAQLTGGVPPFFLDIRPPNEVVAGMLPGAVLCAGDTIKGQLQLLPQDKSIRITVYDQTGDQGADAVAAWLRDQGWGLARRLQGGYAEWLEFAEPTVQPVRVAGAHYQIGQTVQLPGGRTATIHTITPQPQGGHAYLVWVKGALEGPLDEDAFSG
ncbi:MAG: rhodanese-like domain-containing protein [Myxococcota bacterium]